MLTSTLLVTVHGPFKTLDLELPGDIPVGELMPLLLEICGSQQNDPRKMLQTPFSLQVAGARAPLLSDRTLLDAGVCNGAVLVLQTSTPTGSPASRQFAPRSVRPTADTGGIGITWEGLE